MKLEKQVSGEIETKPVNSELRVNIEGIRIIVQQSYSVARGISTRVSFLKIKKFSF